MGRVIGQPGRTGEGQGHRLARRVATGMQPQADGGLQRAVDDCAADEGPTACAQEAAEVPELALIEQTTYKRRWYRPDFDDDEQKALAVWLADRIEESGECVTIRLSPTPAR